MEQLPGDVMQDLINWLVDRECDIADGVEDFGELRRVFKLLIGRDPEPL